jgi:replicative DNA helicase
MLDKQLNFLQEGTFFGQVNEDLEEAVLATFINYPDKFYEFSDQINIKGFSTEANRYIYNSIVECAEESKIDIITVTDKVNSKGYTKRILEKYKFDLIDFINEITETIQTDHHITAHIKLLMAYAMRRELLNLSNEINEDSNEMVNPEEIISKITSKIVELQEFSDVDEFNVTKTLENVVANMNDVQGKNYVKSYIAEIDNFIYGWEYSDLIIIAGAASMGKTAFVLEIVKNNIVNKNKIAIFSLEMSKEQMLTRMIASHGLINLSKIRKKQMKQIDWSNFYESAKYFENKNYFIDDKSGNLNQICNKMRKYNIKDNVRIFIVDYLQLVTIDLKSKSGTREQEISKISRAFKQLCRELKIVIIALSQISRAVSQRANKRPILSDLRESGAIEQDADMVMFVYRPAYYNIEDRIPEVEEVEIIFAKGRSTGIGSEKLKYISQFTKFASEIEFIENEKLQAFKNYTRDF